MSTYAAITRITPAMLPRAVTTSRGDRNAVFRGIGKRVMGETTTYYKLRAPAPTTTGYHEWYNTTGDDTGKPPSPATTGPTVIVERFQVRAYAAPPAIVSATSTTYAGGTITVTGQEFRVGMRVVSPTVDLGTTIVTSKTSATVVVPAGARAGTHTLIAVHVGGNSGSTGVGLLTVAAINPATLPLTLWLSAEDFVDAVHPAQPTWLSRASTGPSGGRRLFRKPARTINPVKIVEGGKPAVFFNGSGGYPTADYASNSQSNIAEAGAGPLVPLFFTDFASVVGGLSFVIVLSHPPGLTTGLTSADANYVNPSIFGGEYGQPNATAGYNPSLIATLNGYQIANTTDNAADYYQGTRPETSVPADTFATISGFIQIAPDNRSAQAAIRANRGSWTMKSFVNSATLIITNANFHIAGFFYAGNYGKTATPKIREILTASSQFSYPVFEYLTDYAAERWNIPM